MFTTFTDKFKSLATFGNPSVNAKKDWVDVINSFVYTAGKVDATTKICRSIASMEIEILTSTLGSKNDP